MTHHDCLFFQPFSDDKLDEESDFLTPPSKPQARSIVESTLENMEASTVPAVEAEKDQTGSGVEQVLKEENQTYSIMDTSGGSSENNCPETSENDLKRKSIFNFLQPPAKTMKTSEFDAYLSEPLCESNSTLLYWKSASRFPKLQGIAKKLLVVPATSGGFDRLGPMAACIVKAKRNRLPPHITERLLLYRNSVKTKSIKKPSGKH